jgi:hypothetical protein
MELFVHSASLLDVDHGGGMSWQDLVCMDSRDFDLSGLDIVMELVLMHEVNSNDVVSELVSCIKCEG